MSAGPAEFTLPHFERWAKRLILDNGKPVKLEPFQRAFVKDVFSGRKVCWLVVPEGNGKTTLLAALGLYGLRFAGDVQDEGASIPVAASARDQARIMYRQMKGFVKRSRLDVPDEGVWFEAFDGYREIQLRSDGSTARGEVLGRIELFGADEGTADGVIPFPFAFLDELHRHKNLALHRTWTGKLGKRGAQLIVISTAGEPGSEFELTREKIRADAPEVFEEGAFGRYASERVVLHEYALRSDDVSDLAAVKLANPLPSVTLKTLAAKVSDPTMTERHWRRFTCNLATLGDGTDPFIEPADWDALVEEGFEIPAFAHGVCLGGDGSRTWDTTVIAWAWQRGDGCVLVDARVFSVRPNVAHHVLHRGGRIDFGDVEAFIIDRFTQFQVSEAAYDPRYLDRSMEIVEQRLPAALIAAVEPQSKSARDALQAMFNLAAEGKLRHSGNPVLAAHVVNTGAERGFSGESRRVRKIDSRLPIDAVPAMAFAVWRAARHEVTAYAERGVLAI
jgi:phage terminase large subunit-like protein